ncbi:unnamed protein product [Protopolystoma xenopodis]|uniref:Uncharacterized protein n=1 Tax=Protopolystoma xenopodis TaxID=117903 RepID=A0A448XCK3_9PLAT|nr:unnamed protein product [Protopolystoma xenopodis]
MKGCALARVSIAKRRVAVATTCEAGLHIAQPRGSGVQAVCVARAVVVARPVAEPAYGPSDRSRLVTEADG